MRSLLLEFPKLELLRMLEAEDARRLLAEEEALRSEILSLNSC